MTAIQLRFQYLNGGTTSPLVLRFDGEPPPPEPDLLPNTIMVLAARYGRAAIQQAQLHARWHSANDLHCKMQIRYSAEAPTTLQLTAPWRLPQLEFVQAVQNWQRSRVLGQNLQLNWTQLPLQQHARMTNWRVAPINQQHWLTNWRRSAIKEQIITTGYSYPGIVDQRFDLVWSSGGGSVTRYYRLPYGPRPPSYICTQNYRPPTGRFRMKFFDPATPQAGSVTLRFSNANNPIICDMDIGGGLIPPAPDVPTIDTTKPIRPTRRRSYVMQPELRCYRLSDNQEINIVSATWSISRSNWAATINLSCGSRIDRDRLLSGGPQLFKLLINGYEFYGLAEEGSMSHSFGQSSWTISGRSSIAALGAPNVSARSYTNATAKNVVALITDELAGSGWTVDFDMTAFNVPANAFSYQNKTPIEAIAQIVAGIGGMLYPDGETNTLHVKPQWPVVPWAMTLAVPDVAIHDNVIISYNSSPANTPFFNAVFVRGEQQGVECKVLRTGSAGNLLAPDTVDAIITDQQAARQRGTAILADCGRKEQYSITLPIMADLPPCLPGMLLGVTWQTDIYKGLVDSINIAASRGNDGSMTVRQQIGVIRSYE